MVSPGDRFGRLVAIARTDTARHRWSFVCDCGKAHEANARLVTRGNIQSCGRLRNELLGNRVRTHGLTGTAERKTWDGMIQRCENPRNRKYPHYGGRGIRVCDRWRHSLIAFVIDMGPRPSQRHSIDRVNNDGSYEPGNCRWATMSEQCRNTRRTRLVEIDGERLPLVAWAERSGIGSETIARRLKAGWEPRAAVFTPSARKRTQAGT